MGHGDQVSILVDSAPKKPLGFAIVFPSKFVFQFLMDVFSETFARGYVKGIVDNSRYYVYLVVFGKDIYTLICTATFASHLVNKKFRKLVLPHLACARVAVEGFVELAHLVRVLRMFKALWLGHIVGGIIIVGQFSLNVGCWNIARSDG